MQGARTAQEIQSIPTAGSPFFPRQGSTKCRSFMCSIQKRGVRTSLVFLSDFDSQWIAVRVQYPRSIGDTSPTRRRCVQQSSDKEAHGTLYFSPGAAQFPANRRRVAGPISPASRRSPHRPISGATGATPPRPSSEPTEHPPDREYPPHAPPPPGPGPGCPPANAASVLSPSCRRHRLEAPFSVVLTDWLSTMAASGSSWRPDATRT